MFSNDFGCWWSDSGDESDTSVSSAKSSDLNEFLDEEERRLRAQPETCPNALHPDLYYNEIHKVYQQNVNNLKKELI